MFVTFEGPDGSGKTTALESLKKKLKEKEIEYILTREPGAFNSAVNHQIRDIIVDNKSDITPMVEVILFSADRRLHLEKLIWPALKEEKLVISDRYFDSTFAYQGKARGLGLEKMIKLQELITDETFPTYTFYFDLPVDESINRINKRAEKNRLDNEGRDFFSKVHEGYKELIKKYPERFIVIDASKGPKEVFNQVWKEFKTKVLSKI